MSRLGLGKDGSLDYTQYQRDLMLAAMADEAVRGGESLQELDQKMVSALRTASGVDESFLPLDYTSMTDPEEPLEKSALDSRTKIDLLKSYLEDVSKIESASRQSVFLSNQDHFTDLTWILSELNRALISWGDDDEDIHHLTARMRIQHLVKSIKAKAGVIK